MGKVQTEMDTFYQYSVISVTISFLLPDIQTTIACSVLIHYGKNRYGKLSKTQKNSVAKRFH